MSPRRAAGAPGRAGWPSLAGGCLLWAAWSEAAVGAGLPARTGAGSAVLLAVTALALAREAALRDGAAPRRRGGALAALASLAAGALVSLAGGAALPAAESAQVVPWWDAAVLASLAARRSPRPVPGPRRPGRQPVRGAAPGGAAGPPRRPRRHGGHGRHLRGPVAGRAAHAPAAPWGRGGAPGLVLGQRPAAARGRGPCGPVWEPVYPCGCLSPRTASRDLRLRGPAPGERHPQPAKGAHTGGERLPHGAAGAHDTRRAPLKCALDAPARAAAAT